MLCVDDWERCACRNPIEILFEVGVGCVRNKKETCYGVAWLGNGRAFDSFVHLVASSMEMNSRREQRKSENNQ